MSVFTITLLNEGQTIGAEYGITSLQVISVVNRIPYAELVLSDGDVATQKFAISNSKDFELGKEIEIKIRYEGTPNTDKTIFKGIVVLQEVNVENQISTLTIGLKDAAQALTKGKNHQIFNDLADSEIIKKILESGKLTVGTLDDTKFKHKDMVQYACSDWDFIVTRAESNGLLVSVQGGRVSVTYIKPPSTPKLTVEYGIDAIYNFSIEANGEGQYAEYSGNAWDIKNQSALSVTKSGSLGLSPGNIKTASVAKKLGGKQYDLKTSETLAQEELTAWANAKLARSQLGLIRGHFAIAGCADLELLDTVEIKGVGERFNGRALITGVGHRITPGNWTTDIQFGLTDEWLLPDDGVNSQLASGLLPAVSGLQIGIVQNFKEDPDKELRIQISLTTHEKKYMVWARLASPDAGKERGFYFRPEPGDEVIVGFINGDPRQAIVLGSMFSSVNKTPKRFSKPDKKNSAKGISSKNGMVIGFDDEKKIVYIETPGKNTVTLDDDGKKIELKDQHGNVIRMDQDGITLKSAKDLTLEASGNVEIKGIKVDIK